MTGAYVGSAVTQIWDSGTGGNPGARAVLQGDGNSVIYSASNAVLWSSDTAGNPGATLVVPNDGNVVLYDGGQACGRPRRTQGATIPSSQSVQITCAVQGFEVADGNTNWYLIASSPWDNAYYASADAFYNNGATSGSRDGTPDVDPDVPAC